MNRQEGKPLAILDAHEHLVEVQTMNRKAFTKSTEHGELWVVHGETGRVLPYEGQSGRAFTTLEEREGFYRAVLAGSTHAAEPAPPSAQSRTVEADLVQGRSAAGGAPADAGRIVAELAAVIAQRRAERPQGSYTTYLFDAGEEKIRKKTGEEAIELVLARDRSEIVSEAADLIYHLLVLLNQLEIPVDTVFAELRRRA